MHSSRMPTVPSGSRLPGAGGGCLVLRGVYSGGGAWSGGGGLYAWSRGVPGPWGGGFAPGGGIPACTEADPGCQHMILPNFPKN